MESPLVERIKQLSPAKQRLLQDKLRERGAEPVASIPRSPLHGRTNRFPCSFSQQSIWLLQQRDPASPLYNYPSPFRFEGELRLDVLTRALGEITRRHAILRTTFEGDDEPLQVVAPSRPVAVPVVDLGGCAAPQRDPETRRLVDIEARRPFDLARGPLLRLAALRLAGRVHVVLLTVHHIISDDWSTGVLVRELVALYGAFAAGGRSPLAPLPIEFVDYADWHRRRFAGPALEAEIDFWRRSFTDLPGDLELAADRPPPTDPTFRGASWGTLYPRPLLDALTALGREHGATPFMTLLAAAAVLLHRHCGRGDLPIGTPVAGRDRLETEGLIGCFINTLLLRLDLGGNPGFVELLARVREVTLGAFAHREVPFERLIGELLRDRDRAGSPPYRVMFSLHNAPVEAPTVEGAKLHLLRWGTRTSKLELILNLQETPRGLEAGADFSLDRFDPTTIQRLLRQFGNLLAAIASDPGRALSSLPMLGPEQRQALLREWNDTKEQRGEGPSVGERFSRQAERTPEAVALEVDDARWTFAEIEARATRLAATLRRRGIGPEARVGLCLDRCAAMVVGVLAVMKSGGAYVPLDPAQPPSRLRALLEDAFSGGVAGVLLCRDDVAPGVLTCGAVPEEAPAGLAVVTVDAAGAEPSAPEPEGPPLEVPPVLDAAVYVLFTSGSTGRPKGVEVTHRGLLNYLNWSAGAYRLEQGSGAPVHSSLGFDLTVTSLFGPLLAGRRVALLPEADSVTALAEALRRSPGWSLVKLTPTHLKALREVLTPAEAGGAARRLVVGGEALLAADLAFWRHHAPALRIVNEYGPTEAVVGCVVHELAAGTADGGAVPVGRPIANARVYLLDRRGDPVPQGATGELGIGGIGLARGYLGRPALTAERFVPERFAAADGEAGLRLYLSGDLGRARPDGRLEFLGRRDAQVKLRGYRIEPAEIEAALARQPGVREAAVVLADGPGGPRLVAWVAADEGHPSVEALRRSLADRLPDYMVPAAYGFLSALPLAASGKVDRRALAERELDRASQAPAGGAAPAPPRNPTEALLVEIWKEVLQVPEVGIHDNFFGLGGDSILSLQVASRARRQGLSLTSRQLFTHPTIAAYAALAAALPGSSGQARPASALERTVPLVPFQRWFFEQGMAHPEHFNQSVLLEAGSPAGGARLGAGVIGRALGALVAHHEALTMRFAPAAPGGASAGQARVSAGEGGEAFALPQVDLAALPPPRREAVATAVAARLQTTLDPAAGVLLRAALFSSGPGVADRLLLIVHHLVVDGVSWRVLLEDLETACRQLAAGERLALPPETASFGRWAERLAEHSRSAAVRAQVDYWLARLGDPGPRLPFDAEDGPNTIASARTVEVVLGEEETQALLREVPRAYRTQINDALLTALVEAFGRWTGRRRVLLGLEGHGREEMFADLDVSRTVGWFTSFYPLLLDVEGAAHPGAALKAVKEQLRAVPDRGTGYGLLRYLGEREVQDRLGAAAQPEVTFNYLGQLDATVGEGRLFRRALGSTGLDRHPEHPRPAIIEVVGAVAGRRLRLSWIYSGNLHRRSTIHDLAQGFVQALRELVDHCRSPQAGGFTPSDFPLAGLDQTALDRLAAAAGVEIEEVYPASPMQQGMLYHALGSPGSGVYVVQLSLRLEVALELPPFEAAWRQLVARHPILRTGFAWEGVDLPLQVVQRRVSLPVRRLDWRGWSAQEQARALAAFLAEDRQRGFDLGLPPLLRLTLVRLGEASHRLVLTLHHAILDGWSTPILLRDLFSFYHAARRGEEAVLPAAVSFREYINWLAQQDPAAGEEFWRRELAGVTAPTPFAVDRGGAGPPAGGAAEPYQVEDLTLAPAEAMALRGLGRRLEVTLNTVIQGAWGLLLHRYTGQADVVFGAVTAGRSAPVPGIEEIVGPLINTLPVRVKPVPAQVLPIWLVELQERQNEARRFEHNPLWQVRGWSEVSPGEPLFESIVVFENYPVDASVEERAGRDLRLSEVAVTERTNYPLTLVVAPDRELLLRVAYETQRFERVVVLRMLGHLRNLLAGMVARPRAPLALLALLAPCERQQALYEWGEGPRDGGAAGCLHSLVERQAVARPEALALVMGDSQTSYGELDRRGDRLARHLRGLGVGLEARVGLCGERSVAAVAAMLGALKAGAGYVPLDPESPRERLAAIASDADLAALLATEAGAPVVAGLAPELVVVADSPASDGSPLPARPQAPESAAYVIYTSGSTGEPKGVVATHGGVTRFLHGLAGVLGVGPRDRWLLFAPLNFDASVLQIFLALSQGAALLIHPQPRELGSGDLVDLAARHGLTLLDLPAARWRQWVDDVQAQGLPIPAGLRWFLTGGESVPVSKLRSWAQLVGGRASFLSSYGPTEATVTASVFACASDRLPPLCGAHTPIGRPLPGVRALVLGRRLAPSPWGVPGALCLGGPGLARSYLGRPRLTAEAFRPDPVGGEAGQRLYHTGDLARRLPAGDLEFLGRADHQVKLRGFRLELGEVEAALALHSGVREAVVSLREDLPGQKRLVAYVVAAPEPPADGELRRFLGQRLPDYMVPATFVFLAALPLSATGKVDREALPAPERSRGGDLGEMVAPRNARERQLVEIWEEVLDVRPIGVRDGFFELGGNSLLALRLVGRIRQRVGRAPSLADLFRHDTIEAVTETLDGQAEGSPPSPLLALRAGGHRPPFFCVHPAGGNSWVYRALAHHLGPEQPFYGLQARGIDSEHEPLADLEAMARSYVEAVRSVAPRGPYLLGGWSFGGVAAFEMARQLVAAGERVAALVMLDTPAPGQRQEAADLDEPLLLASFAAEHGLAVAPEELRRLGGAERLVHLAELGVAAGVLPAGSQEAAVRFLDRKLLVFRACLEAVRGYRPRRYDGAVVYLRAAEQEEGDPAIRDARGGWADLATGPVSVHTIPGRHDTIVKEPHVQAAADVLRRILCGGEAAPGRRAAAGALRGSG